jgi:hypothetical protein
MPHFSFWAWPNPFVGSFSRAAAAIETIEYSLPFFDKKGQAVWRGTEAYNPPHYPHLREDLLKAGKGKYWADIQALRWENGDGKDTVTDKTLSNKTVSNSIMPEDFCKYKYVIHTEGVTYSGRLQLLQLCGSVLLTPPIAWMQHTTHLVKPIWSSDLLRDRPASRKSTWKPTEDMQRAWPTRFTPEEGNAIFVAPDWSDLEDTVKWLEDHGDVAEGIASRQRDIFARQGYLSPAAEACYWRALIRAWTTVVTIDAGEWEGWDEVSWEVFALGQGR